jgi:hypothetical protein
MYVRIGKGFNDLLRLKEVSTKFKTFTTAIYVQNQQPNEFYMQKCTTLKANFLNLPTWETKKVFLLESMLWNNNAPKTFAWFHADALPYFGTVTADETPDSQVQNC